MYPRGAGPHSVFLVKCKSELKVGHQLFFFMHLLQEDHTISLESGFEALQDICTSPFLDRSEYLFLFSFLFLCTWESLSSSCKKKHWTVSKEQHDNMHSLAASHCWPSNGPRPLRIMRDRGTRRLLSAVHFWCKPRPLLKPTSDFEHKSRFRSTPSSIIRFLIPSVRRVLWWHVDLHIFVRRE